MEAITVFAANQEQSRALKAFVKAMKMTYVPAPQDKLADRKSVV